MATLSDIQYLQRIYEYVKMVWDRMRMVEGQYEYIEIGSNDSDDIFKYMIELNGFNKMPEIVSDPVFDRLKSPKLYRGATNPAYNYNLVSSNKYHHGSGYTNGIFSSTSRLSALQYTFSPISFLDYSQNKVDNNVMSFKIKDAKKAYYKVLECIATQIRSGNFNYFSKEIKTKLNHFVEFLLQIPNDDDCLHFMNLFLEDYSKLALYFGYDAIVNEEDVIILNRGKMALSESEYLRVKNAASVQNSPRMQQSQSFDNEQILMQAKI